MNILKMTDVDLKNKRVLIREDFNVPIENGKITSDARIRAALPTIEYALKQNAKIILMSHMGRPKEGGFDPALSLKLIVECLSTNLNKPIHFVSDWSNGFEIKNGEIVLLENARFLVGNKKNDPALSQKMAALCDVFVMDAFATAHRAESSTSGVIEFAPIACAGFLLSAELEALQKALEKPARPLVAVVGGSKVSTKLEILDSLIKKVDQLIVGGGIANTFLAAKGFPVGKSLCEFDLIDTAKNILLLAEKNNVNMPLPTDVVVAKEISNTAHASIKNVSDVSDDDMILDIGPQTADHYATILQKAKTILWNGPVGVFEFSPFENGTKIIAQAIAHSPAFSIAGGGDTLAAIEKFNIENKISYISTGGGAFLEFVEGKELPAVKILQQRGQYHD
jgi:phosphoglycerate kinase